MCVHVDERGLVIGVASVEVSIGKRESYQVLQQLLGVCCWKAVRQTNLDGQHEVN